MGRELKKVRYARDGRPVGSPRFLDPAEAKRLSEREMEVVDPGIPFKYVAIPNDRYDEAIAILAEAKIIPFGALTREAHTAIIVKEVKREEQSGMNNNRDQNDKDQI